MATAEQNMTALENQLAKVFKLAESLNKSTEEIIEKGEERKIVRQMKNLTEKTEEIHEIKELLREAKFTAHESNEDVEQAIKEIEERAEIVEDAVDELDFKLTKIQAEAKQKARQEEIALEQLLQEKPKQEILGLPFSSEGYQQAKERLERKYCIDSEIITAHVTQILGLSVVMRHDVVKIHDFYQKLNLSVQSLKTLKKLSTVEGVVRMTLDKLECIKSDLIRTEDDWRSWDFPKLEGKGIQNANKEA
eukprot:gene19343-21261_t